MSVLMDAFRRLAPPADPAAPALPADWLERLALGLTLLSPLLLLHARSGMEAAIVLVALLFLGHSARQGRWAWLRQGWMPLGLAWWLWQLLCSLPPLTQQPLDQALQAAGMLRFLVFVAALEHWVLRAGRARHWLLLALAAATLYVVVQTLVQFATGYNLYGAPRWGDGELTGPFTKPRAGPTYIRMLFPVWIPAVALALRRPGLAGWAGAAALLLGGMAVLVLIGQRMPVLLGLLGLLVAGLLLKRLRLAVIATGLAGLLLVGLSATLSPPAYYRLVTKFSAQMESFPTSHYGQIAGRSLAMARQHPWTGLGFGGFKTHCAEPRYHQGWSWPQDPADQGGGAGICVTHPHSFYLQALTDSGIPGLLLFTALVAAWLWHLGRGLLREPDPLRVGLFIGVLIQIWPIASTSSLATQPNAGWLFLLLGFGLACAPRHSRGE